MVKSRQITPDEIPQKLLEDITVISEHAYRSFLSAMKPDDVTIRDVFTMAFTSGVMNAYIMNPYFKCSDNNCDGDCDNCDVTKFIPIHHLAKCINDEHTPADDENIPEHFD